MFEPDVNCKAFYYCVLPPFISTFHLMDKFKSTFSNTTWNWNEPPKNLIFQNILMKVLHWSPHGIGITICANFHLTVMGSTSNILRCFLRPYKIVLKSFLLLLLFLFSIFLIVNWSACSMFNLKYIANKQLFNLKFNFFYTQWI